MIFHSFLYIYQRVVTFKVDELWAFPFGLLHNIRYQSTNSQDDPLSSDLYQANIWFGEDCKSLNISKNNNNNIWYNYKYIMYVGVYIYIHTYMCMSCPQSQGSHNPTLPQYVPPMMDTQFIKTQPTPSVRRTKSEMVKIRPILHQDDQVAKQLCEDALSFRMTWGRPHIFFGRGNWGAAPVRIRKLFGSGPAWPRNTFSFIFHYPRW